MLSSPSKTYLFARWVLFNALLIAVCIVSYANGVFDMLLVDETYLTHAIALFGFMVVMASGYTSYTISKIWNDVGHLQNMYRSHKANDNGNDMKDQIIESTNAMLAPYGLASTLLVSFGLIGTVVGISIAFMDISPDVIADASASQAVMATLLAGLATAFHTTLVGIVGMVWNTINLYMMRQEASRMFRLIFGTEL